MMYLTLIALLISSYYTYSQSSIKSQIISAKGKDALNFVHIFNKDSHLNTLSDPDGWFNIQCNNDDTLVIRCMGYKTLAVVAAKVNQKAKIELTEDTITLREISVSPQSAYRMLLQARDSTNKHQMKSFQGKCLRQDILSLNGLPGKKSEAEIIFVQKKIKHELADVDYWLNELKSESFEHINDLPRVHLSNKIPLNAIKLQKGKSNYRIIKNSDSLIIINAKMEQVSGQFTNENNYFINKETWIIKGIEYKGDFKLKPLKKGNYHFFQTDAKLTYDAFGDSCVLNKYSGKFVFSHKKVDPQDVWEYSVNMDIIPTQNTTQMPEDKKLRRTDYLLYKNKDKNLKE